MFFLLMSSVNAMDWTYVTKFLFTLLETQVKPNVQVFSYELEFPIFHHFCFTNFNFDLDFNQFFMKFVPKWCILAMAMDCISKSSLPKVKLIMKLKFFVKSFNFVDSLYAMY